MLTGFILGLGFLITENTSKELSFMSQLIVCYWCWSIQSSYEFIRSNLALVSSSKYQKVMHHFTICLLFRSNDESIWFFSLISQFLCFTLKFANFTHTFMSLFTFSKTSKSLLSNSKSHNFKATPLSTTQFPTWKHHSIFQPTLISSSKS